MSNRQMNRRRSACNPFLSSAICTLFLVSQQSSVMHYKLVASMRRHKFSFTFSSKTMRRQYICFCGQLLCTQRLSSFCTVYAVESEHSVYRLKSVIFHNLEYRTFKYILIRWNHCYIFSCRIPNLKINQLFPV